MNLYTAIKVDVGHPAYLILKQANLLHLPGTRSQGLDNCLAYLNKEGLTLIAREVQAHAENDARVYGTDVLSALLDGIIADSYELGDLLDLPALPDPVICATVASSFIHSIQYGQATKALVVNFHNGRLYAGITGCQVYPNMPRTVVRAFLASDSKGKFYNKYIKG